MACLIVAIVVYGFSFAIKDNLLFPSVPRPTVLYAHALVFAAWISVFLFQASLVRSGQVRLHRRVGLAALFLGALVTILGVATAFAMARFHAAQGDLSAVQSLPVPLWDMVSFTSMFVLAAALRKRPEHHRRLMLLATISLTAAAFGRMPAFDHAEWFYAGVDALILVAVARDLVVDKRVHVVYRIGGPAIVAGQLLAAYTRWSHAWLSFSSTIFGS